MSDKTRGFYQKFFVERTDGRSAPGEKHDGCDYFVLDMTHDPHALLALRAYTDACKEDYPRLARGLRHRLGLWEHRQKLEQEREPGPTPGGESDE